MVTSEKNIQSCCRSPSVLSENYSCKSCKQELQCERTDRNWDTNICACCYQSGKHCCQNHTFCFVYVVNINHFLHSIL